MLDRNRENSPRQRSRHATGDELSLRATRLDLNWREDLNLPLVHVVDVLPSFLYCSLSMHGNERMRDPCQSLSSRDDALYAMRRAMHISSIDAFSRCWLEAHQQRNHSIVVL